MNKQELRQALYAASPFDLVSENDDKYRNAIDSVLDYEVKNPAAVALGSIKLEKKTKASRVNGKKGGRPTATPPARPQAP